MGRYWRLMGHYDAETATYSACVGAFAPSPYNPPADGKLVGLRTVVGRTAATSLTDAIQFRLTSATFQPINELQAMAIGTGLQTAPAMPAPIVDFEVNQPVKAGTPISVEGRCANASAVTNDVYLWGCFE